MLEAGVHLAVGHVVAETAGAHHDLPVAGRIDSEPLERAGGPLAPPALGLGEQGHGLADVHRQQVVLVVEAAGVVGLVALDAPLDVGAVGAVAGHDLQPVGGVLTHHPGDAQQLHRLVEGEGAHVHVLEQRRRSGPDVGLVVVRPHLHVRPVLAVLHHHGQGGLRVLAQHHLVGDRQDFLGPGRGQLVGRYVVGDRLGVVAPLQIGPVLAHAGHDRDPVGVGADGDRVDGPSVDVAQAFVHLGLQAGDVLDPEVEMGEPGHGFFGAAGDRVEVGLHLGREGVVDQVGEVLLQEGDHGEGEEARHQSGALAPGIAPVLDRAHDGGVGGRAPHPQLLQPLDQRRFGVAGRGLGVVPGGLDLHQAGPVAVVERRQALLVGVVALVTLVGALHVDPQEALVGDHGAGSGEQAVAARGAVGRQPEGHGLARGVGHLGGDRAPPDQLVDGQVLGRQLARHLLGGAEPVAGRPDGLVGLLGVLHLGGVGAGLGRAVLGPEPLLDLAAGGVDGGLRQRGGVGPHVGDVTPLVEPLGDPHGLGRREPQLAAGLLLVGGGDEGGGRAAAVGLGLPAGHGGRAVAEVVGQASGTGLVEVDDLVALQGAR